jgi:hypothetical protein
MAWRINREAPLTVPAQQSRTAGYNGAGRFGGHGVNVLLAFSMEGK